MSLTIETLVLGPLMTNCYVLREGRDCWVVDPGAWPDKLLEFLKRTKMSPSRILLTHGHGDHIAGIAELKSAYPSAVMTCPVDDAPLLGDAALNLSADFDMPVTAPDPDELVRPGDTIRLRSTDWQALDTSGHTPGGMSYYCPQEHVVITGDTLFAGGIGRYDIPGADGRRLVDNIRRNLLSLPPETQVLPGHGGPTTIDRERGMNPFLAL